MRKVIVAIAMFVCIRTFTTHSNHLNEAQQRHFTIFNYLQFPNRIDSEKRAEARKLLQRWTLDRLAIGIEDLKVMYSGLLAIYIFPDNLFFTIDLK